MLLIHQARRLPDNIIRYIILAAAMLLTWFGAGLITAAIGAETLHIWAAIALIVGGLLWRDRFRT